MPRDRIDDPDTPGLYVQVNCRRANDAEGGGSPGHLQISTHDERADLRALQLLEEADRLVAMLVSAVHSGEPDSQTMIDAREEWRAKWFPTVPGNVRSELTGTYVTLDPETSLRLVKLIHRGRNLAHPPGSPKVPGLLDGVRIPRAGEVRNEALDPPGATGYPLRDIHRQG